LSKDEQAAVASLEPPMGYSPPKYLSKDERMEYNPPKYL
jgi:hypothetical protein